MDRLESMRVFVQVASLRSFAAAARQLALSPAQVTRAVAAVEQRCGAKLLTRTTRVVRLTETGATYLTQCRRILAELDEAEAQAGSDERGLHGQISITAPRLFGRLHVAPLALDFLGQHAGVALRMLIADHVLDLFEQNIDVAVRIGHLPDSSLHAVRVGSVRRMVCASPRYLRRHGTPREPADVTAHRVIAFSGLGEPQAWSFVVDGKRMRARTTPRLIVNAGELAIEAACAGYGLTRVLSYQVAQELADKRLRVVLADFEHAAIPVHVVYTAGKAASKRVRALVEHLVSGLRGKLAHADVG